MGEIFSQLFPQEYYNAFSSANRVHQLLWRLRKWLSENRVPARLVEASGKFSLRIEGPFAFAVPYQRLRTTEHALEIHKIKGTFGTAQWFSQREVRNKLQMSSAVRRQ